MRDRSGVVIIENKKVLLIKRIRNDAIYYVFPGGGIEYDESPIEGAIREAFEELGVKVKIKECISKIQYNGTQYYYLAEIISGTVGTGMGDEYVNPKRGLGSYQPIWVYLNDLTELDVRPREVAITIQSLYQ